jgi:hypothetical protein
MSSLATQTLHVRRAGWIAVLVLAGVFAGGCAPRLIQDYSVRKNDLVFAVQQGSSYQLGDCRRAENGDLSQCRVYEVEFE